MTVESVFGGFPLCKFKLILQKNLIPVNPLNLSIARSVLFTCSYC